METSAEIHELETFLRQREDAVELHRRGPVDEHGKEEDDMRTRIQPSKPFKAHAYPLMVRSFP